jgi:hypothetical protein
MSKLLLVAVAAAAAVGSVVAASDANARYVRAPRAYYVPRIRSGIPWAAKVL